MTERWPRPAPRDDGDPIVGLEKDHVDAILARLREHRAASSRHAESGVLGQGGMGIVLEVRDADLRRPLALKRLHPKRAAQAEGEAGRHYLARFLQEAQVTGQLAHPGIPPVHELSIDDQGPYFTMPLIRGQNLDEVFAKARSGTDGWSLARALGVLLKVCEAMAFAHAKRVVHRDLKPENVRIGRFGEVYVMDWGLARVIGRDGIDLVRWSAAGPMSSVHTDREDSDGDANEVLQTLDGDVLGTPFYMPPEQARGELERVGPRTDVYAVGGLLYLLLTGRAPYQPAEGRISPRTVLAAVLHGPPAPVASIAPDADADLVAICEKAMARELAARYASMEELAADIEAWIDRRPIRASAPSVRHALRLFAERHRAAVLTAAAASFFLLLSVVGFVWRLTREVEAKDEARLAAELRGDVLSVAALETREAAELWPATPERVPAIEAWIAELDAILQRRSEADARAKAIAPEVETLRAGLARLAELRPRVEDRLDTARTLPQRSRVDAAARWNECAADLRQSPRFAGLELEPQEGLVPLRKSAASGLWEFAHLLSGTVPATDGDRLQIHEDAGVVLVLLPGAEYELGRPNADGKTPQAEQLRKVTIEPFFIAAHELTQAQWMRVFGNNPSRDRPGIHTGTPTTLSHPVETVTWNRATECARRLALRLPTMAEWEYAARGASTNVYGYGMELDSLEGHENVRDKTWGWGAGNTATWEDPYRCTSPVGHFPANALGLYDMLGNVSEWCADRFEAETPVTFGTPEAGTCAFRGGSWYQTPLNCRPTMLQFNGPDEANLTNGLRLARSVSRSQVATN